LHPGGRVKAADADDRDVELGSELFGLREIESLTSRCETFGGALDDGRQGDIVMRRRRDMLAPEPSLTCPLMKPL